MNRTKIAKKQLVSIYMPVFNASKYLRQAIESILNQTYTHFEFIIIDDTSTDDSWKIIKSYAKRDKRIRAIQNPINLGHCITCNIAISKAKSKYIAKMDADDISFDTRIEKQMAYMLKHPEVVALGTQCIVIDKDDNIIGNKNFPTTTKESRDSIFWAIPIQHPTILMNISKLPSDFRWYEPHLTSGEEVNVFFRFLLYGEITNLPEDLFFYRHLDNSLSHINLKKSFYSTLRARIGVLSLGFRPNIKSVLMNICQIIAIHIISPKLLNKIWYFIKGKKNLNLNLTVRTFAQSQV